MQIDPSKASIVLKALSDETRLRIMVLLASGEHGVTELAGKVGKAQPTVSLDLKVLESAGLVQKRVTGKRRIYSISETRKATVESILREAGS
jgi:ArsR family transcriptional regulator, cadmium/lead-responsive transcriptional repressor